MRCCGGGAGSRRVGVDRNAGAKIDPWCGDVGLDPAKVGGTFARTVIDVVVDVVGTDRVGFLVVARGTYRAAIGAFVAGEKHRENARGYPGLQSGLIKVLSARKAKPRVIDDMRPQVRARVLVIQISRGQHPLSRSQHI